MDKLRYTLIALLDEKMIDNVVFKQRVSVDRSTLEIYSTSADEFVDMFCEVRTFTPSLLYSKSTGRVLPRIQV